MDILNVEKDRLLLVEGRDEQVLFEKILGQNWTNGIQVIDAGGINRFPGMLAALLAEARVKNIDLQSIGMVRDADEDASAAFQSICSAVSRNGLIAPPQTEVLSTGTPSVAILILPGNGAPGALEDVCLSSISGHPAADCIKSYIRCLRQRGVMESSNAGKTAVHAYLASKADPTSNVGRGAEHDYWDIGSPAFAIIRDFIALIECS